MDSGEPLIEAEWWMTTPFQRSRSRGVRVSRTASMPGARPGSSPTAAGGAANPPRRPSEASRSPPTAVIEATSASQTTCERPMGLFVADVFVVAVRAMCVWDPSARLKLRLDRRLV